jgi:protein gp37
MGDKSAIQWTDATWNPVTGCSKVSPGCAHCYAENLTRRFASTWGVPDLPWTPENAAENVILHPERLDQPLRWKRPRMVFVNSMSDLFHELIPDDYIAKVFAVMALAHQHTFQVLTKRPERMRDLLKSWPFAREVMEQVHELGRGIPNAFIIADVVNDGFDQLTNIWLGTSIENRAFVHRADLLRETPAHIRFISAEPLLGPLLPDAEYMEDAEHEHWPLDDFDVRCWRPWADGKQVRGLSLELIDWLIVGGESGPGHRPMREEWVRDLRDATRCSLCCGDGGAPRQGDGWCETCEGLGHNGTAFFMKQLENLPADLRIREMPHALVATD